MPLLPGEVVEYRLERPGHLRWTEPLGHRGVADLTVEVAPPAVPDPGVLLHAAGVGAACAQLREVESGRHRHGAETLRRGPITDLAIGVRPPAVGLRASGHAA